MGMRGRGSESRADQFWKKPCFCAWPSPLPLPHAVVQVKRDFSRLPVRRRRRHGDEGEGFREPGGPVLEKTMFLRAF